MEKVEVRLVDALLAELLRVSAKAGPGAHFEAARRMNITPDAELKARKGLIWTVDSASNHQKLRQLKKIYQNINEGK